MRMRMLLPPQLYHSLPRYKSEGSDSPDKKACLRPQLFYQAALYAAKVPKLLLISHPSANSQSTSTSSQTDLNWHLLDGSGV
eukprot:scaffold33587_cov107-Skeletonema_dohrnii-CCMP3373.AAC.6